MKQFVAGLLLFLCAAAGAFGQSGNTQITANNIAYFGGTKVTGQFCLTPTNQAGQAINLVTPTGQQVSPSQPLCFPVTAGVLSSSAIVPDTSMTQPANACYNVTINNYYGQQIADYPCVQPSTNTWSFDGYVPSGTAAIPSYTAPQFELNGSPLGSIVNFSAPSWTASGPTITVPAGSGGSSIAGTFVFSPIILRPGRVILLVPNQPIVLE